ncbi:hypothetical protein QJS10_CPA03g01477 [Acorus calamus]|uniref:DUF674 family protein n=1 Tax=Acorus calamus TaxID=4465 RepID=A0AAV9F373_ACOCL|nr:hypothetical protein QJS10_CPA03g01477 [Acorus calamus]
MATNKKHCLKLLVDNRSQRVLFAEADKTAVDFLFGLLSLPLGSVVKHLNKKCTVGSLGDLYGSFESLSGTHIQLGQNKASSSTQPNSTLHSQVGSFPSAPALKNKYNCG